MREAPSQLKDILKKYICFDLICVLYFQHGFTVFFLLKGAKSNVFLTMLGKCNIMLHNTSLQKSLIPLYSKS